LAYFRTLPWSVLVPRVFTAIAACLILTIPAAFVPSVSRAQAAPLEVQNAWVRKPPGVDTAAVYFVLKNNSTKPVTVLGATSNLAEHVMIHETSTVDGQSRMRMRDKFTIAPGKTLALAPEGMHVMLSGFRYAVAVGDTVPLTLKLEGGGALKVTAVVRPLDAK
jgi:periplasmic copper chaperone A